MKTITIQIGNSDDKLTQKDWHAFCVEVGDAAVHHSEQVHFCGASHNSAPWQNAAWVIEINDEDIEGLKDNLTKIREHYRQDSVTFTTGDTLFI